MLSVGGIKCNDNRKAVPTHGPWATLPRYMNKAEMCLPRCGTTASNGSLFMLQASVHIYDVNGRHPMFDEKGAGFPGNDLGLFKKMKVESTRENGGT